MVFTDTDLPPILLSGAAQYGVSKPGQTKRKLTKPELTKLLEGLAMNVEGNVKQLQHQARVAGIPITGTKGIVEESFMGKPKGAAQIVKRGFLTLEGALPDVRNARCTVRPQRIT